MYARLVGIGCLEGDMNGNNINRVVAIENECPGLENLGILALWSSCSVDFLQGLLCGMVSSETVFVSVDICLMHSVFFVL